MTSHTLESAGPGAGNARTKNAHNVSGSAAHVAQPEREHNSPEPPWWLASSNKRRKFPRPLSYGFVRDRWWGPLRFSVRPGRRGRWLFQWHPNPDTRLDREVDVATLLDPQAMHARLARHGTAWWAKTVMLDNPDWRDWMLDLVERGEGGR